MSYGLNEGPPPLGGSRKDPLTPSERSERMARVKSRGNRSTELKVISGMRSRGIKGWRRHRKFAAGTPDFYFHQERLAIFVDGCFWHSCPKCNRRLPEARAEFWRDKLARNAERDKVSRQQFRNRGIGVMRIWEHELRASRWLDRLSCRIAVRTERMNRGMRDREGLES